MSIKVIALGIVSMVALAACSTTTSMATPTPAASPTPTITQQETASPVTLATYTLADVEKHNSDTDCWMAVDGSVYDVSNFVDQHPGGERILMGCGKDASSIFASIPKHEGPRAQDLLPKFKIGTLGQ